MLVQTKYFGQVECGEEQELHFPRGLFGFEEEKRFLLLPFEELRELGVERSEELCFYVLCVVRDKVSESSVNLRCPIALNDHTRTAMQVILETDAYQMHHPLSEFGRTEEGAPC